MQSISNFAFEFITLPPAEMLEQSREFWFVVNNGQLLEAHSGV